MMGRIYKPKPGSRKYGQYTQENLQAALSSIAAGSMSITKASKHYNIAKGTLMNKIKSKHVGKVGRPLVFSDMEERSMIQHMQAVAEWGFPFDNQDLRYLAKIYLDKCGRKVPQFGPKNFPSNEWAWRFLQRHKRDLTQRLCQNLKKSKAAVTAEEMTEYFNHLQQTLQEENENGELVTVPPERIFNYDETNLADDPGVKRCIFKRGVKYPERIRDSSKSSTSMMYCGSAAGMLLPPYVVYKSGHLWQTWMEGGPPFTRYNRSLSGWFDSVVFKDWFENMFLPHTRNLNGRKILIGDNLSSHFTPAVISLAESNNVSFVCIPPNTTHIAQPLDVAFYAPLKRYWRTTLDQWKGSNQKRSQTLSKEMFPKLLKSLHEKLCNEDNLSDNIVSGFKKCGIFPFNPSAVVDRIPKAVPEEEIAVSNSVSDAVLEMLKSMRHTPSNQSRQKRRKITTPPGIGITYEEVSANSSVRSSNSSNCASKSSQQKRKVTCDSDSELSEDSVDIPYVDSSDDMIDYSSEESSENSNVNTKTRLHKENDTALEKDEFVIVKVPVQSKKNSANIPDHKFYIGQVTEINANKTCGIAYLRKKSRGSAVFVWPQITDSDTIDLVQVERRLRTPDKLKRGFRFMTEDIEEYILN